MPYLIIIPLIIVAVSAVVGVIFFLPADQPPEEPGVTREVESVEQISVQESVQQNTYADGTYTADADYFTPKRQRHILSVTLAIQNDTVTSAGMKYDGAEAKTPSHQRFDGAYEPLLVGVAVDDLDLARVGGASLTTTAFNEALGDIKSDASSQ